MNLKTHADSLAFAKKMEAAYAEEPDNEIVFGLVCNMYSGMNMNAELAAVGTRPSLPIRGISPRGQLKGRLL